MAKPIITLIGLGVTGASLGLALRQQLENIEVVGHDKNSDLVQAARRGNAVHRTEWNLHSACAGAGLIVFSVPLNEVDELLPHVREDLQPQTLVLILTNIIQPALDLLTRHLPTHTHALVGHAILTGMGGSLRERADLFQESTICLASGAQTEAAAIQLASDFVERVGAKPLYMDALEHDGLGAGVEQLPQLLAAMLMQMSNDNPGWREARRLAGRTFAQATTLEVSAGELFTAIQANRTNLLLRLDQLQQELTHWRGLLALDGTQGSKEGSDHPLRAALESAVDARIRWEGQTILKNWEEAPVTVSPPAPARGFLRQMLFGGLGGKK